MGRRSRKQKQDALPWEDHVNTPKQNFLAGGGCGCGCLGVVAIAFTALALYYVSLGLVSDPFMPNMIGTGVVLGSVVMIFVGFLMMVASLFVE